MKGKTFQEINRLHMLSDLTSSAKYPEVKQVAEGWRATNRTGMPQTCYLANGQKKNILPYNDLCQVTQFTNTDEVTIFRCYDKVRNLKDKCGLLNYF